MFQARPKASSGSSRSISCCSLSLSMATRASVSYRRVVAIMASILAPICALSRPPKWVSTDGRRCDSGSASARATSATNRRRSAGKNTLRCSRSRPSCRRGTSLSRKPLARASSAWVRSRARCARVAPKYRPLGSAGMLPGTLSMPSATRLSRKSRSHVRSRSISSARRPARAASALALSDWSAAQAATASSCLRCSSMMPPRSRPAIWPCAFL